MFELLFAAMMAIAGGEIHDIDTAARKGYRDGAAELARINIETAQAALLVSPEVDAALTIARGLIERRGVHRLDVMRFLSITISAWCASVSEILPVHAAFLSAVSDKTMTPAG